MAVLGIPVQGAKIYTYIYAIKHVVGKKTVKRTILLK